VVRRVASRADARAEAAPSASMVMRIFDRFGKRRLEPTLRCASEANRNDAERVTGWSQASRKGTFT
jgi:hypothetical protein